ncbi:MAG: hypothetical protein JWM41_1917 [Gemmatimonadetes bacterium]|nr:hypothetical protein [Gemmatimonadota bacterium]
MARADVAQLYRELRNTELTSYHEARTIFTTSTIG